MNRKIMATLAVVILAFLIIRMFRSHVDGIQAEKIWYISKLDFEFSGELDSAEIPGRILFHVTEGSINRSKEKELHKRLKYNGILELLLYRPDGKLDLWIRDRPRKFFVGDSLYLNSGEGVVRFYRNGALLSQHKLVTSLRGRPF